MVTDVPGIVGIVNLSILLKRLQLLLYSLNKYIPSFFTNSGSENSWKYDCKQVRIQDFEMGGEFL